MAGGDKTEAHDWQTPSSDVIGEPQLGQIETVAVARLVLSLERCGHSGDELMRAVATIGVYRQWHNRWLGVTISSEPAPPPRSRHSTTKLAARAHACQEWPRWSRLAAQWAHSLIFADRGAATAIEPPARSRPMATLEATPSGMPVIARDEFLMVQVLEPTGRRLPFAITQNAAVG